MRSSIGSKIFFGFIGVISLCIMGTLALIMLMRSGIFAPVTDLAAVIVGAMVLTVLGLSYLLSCAIASNIERPIKAVSKWAKMLSVGDDRVSFSTLDMTGINKKSSLYDMIDSFKNMVSSIQNNANVVARVASGDMTAYVDVRSKDDVLGANLYRMVQENDMLFAEVRRATNSVMEAAGKVSRASMYLAKSTSSQAEEAREISRVMSAINVKTKVNTGKTKQVSEQFSGIMEGTTTLTKQIENVASYSKEINEITGEIESILKIMDDISLQTNILALNLCVEISRMGNGGASEVAEELGELVCKNSEILAAASELGSTLSQKVADTLNLSQNAEDTALKTEKAAANTLKVIDELCTYATEQAGAIEIVCRNISTISSVAAINATNCTEASSSSAMLFEEAAALRKQTNRFILRTRNDGKPYIPPEKQGDEKFAAQAERNYHSSLRKGNVVYATEEERSISIKH